MRLLLDLFWLLVFVGAFAVLIVSLQQNHRYGEEIGKYFHTNRLLTGLSGIAAWVAIVGLVLLLFGKKSAIAVVIGVALTILLQLPALKEASDDLAKSKKVVLHKIVASPDSPSGAGSYDCLGPVPVYFRLLLIGMGKAMVMVLYISLIGIPIYRGLIAQQKEIERYSAQANAQAQLKAEYEWMETQTYLNRANRKKKEGGVGK